MNSEENDFIKNKPIFRRDNEDDIDSHSHSKADDDEDDEAVVNDEIEPTNDTKENTNINDHNNNDSTNHLTISNQTTSSSSSRQSHRAKAKIDHAKYGLVLSFNIFFRFFFCFLTFFFLSKFKILKHFFTTILFFEKQTIEAYYFRKIVV